MLTGYCKFCAELPLDNLHKVYHDNYYGFPITDDNELFGRLLLEINQAGLSWDTILKKQVHFFEAYDGFDIKKVAKYTTKDKDRLLNDSGIIRNKLKIEAAIFNARKIVSLQEEFGSFYNWLDLNHPLSKEEWVKLFKKNFKFTGGEIVGEFLMSIGFLKGAHCKNCTVFDDILIKRPKWLE